MGSRLSRSSHPDCFELLPDEAAHRVASFLLGVELIALAHANPALFTTLNSPRAWATRVDPTCLQPCDPIDIQPPPPTWWSPAKLAYLRHRTLLFGEDGSSRWVDRLHASKSRRVDKFVLLPVHRLRDNNFGIELWFSVYPTRPGGSSCHAGILVGFQSAQCSPNSAPKWFVALAAVDSNGGLRLMASDKHAPTTIAARVTFGTWHHLALSFDSWNVRAFLDGELRYVKRFVRDSHWNGLCVGQVGTGYGYDPNRTLATHHMRSTAWRPFHGLVTRARVWERAIPEDDARWFARGADFSSQHLLVSSDEDMGVLQATRVVSSIPNERYARVLPHS